MTKKELYYEQAKLCACGDPDGKYNFMCTIVELAEAWHKEETPDWRTIGKIPPVADALELGLQGSLELRQHAAAFILDMMNNLGFLEHGGGARCSWPTALGYELLEQENSGEEL